MEAIQEEIMKIVDLIAEYDVKCVFNMDKIGLFYRLLPRRETEGLSKEGHEGQ